MGQFSTEANNQWQFRKALVVHLYRRTQRVNTLEVGLRSDGLLARCVAAQATICRA